MPDPEIQSFLARPMTDEQKEQAGRLLQRFRAEALAGVRRGADREAREQLVEEARTRLREALRRLLG